MSNYLGDVRFLVKLEPGCASLEYLRLGVSSVQRHLHCQQCEDSTMVCPEALQKALSDDLRCMPYYVASSHPIWS